MSRYPKGSVGNKPALPAESDAELLAPDSADHWPAFSPGVFLEDCSFNFGPVFIRKLKGGRITAHRELRQFIKDHHIPVEWSVE